MIDIKDGERKYLVYLHTLQKNDKNMYYVGVTCREPQKRWRNGYGYKDNDHFFRSIQKYGWDNFKHEILSTNLTREEANDLEKYYIAFYKSYDSNYGYNKTLGGENKKNISSKKDKKVYQFSLDYNFIDCYKSISVAERITNTTQIHSGIKNHKTRNNFLWGLEEDVYFDGKTYHLKYTYENNQGKRYPIYQFDKNGVFVNKYDGYKHAEKETGVSQSIIRKSVENSYKSYYKHDYLWRKEKDIVIVNNIVQNIELRENEKPPKDTIFKFDLNGKFLQSYLSTSEIYNKHKYIKHNICSAMKNDNHTAYGFLWRYIDDVIIKDDGDIIIKNFHDKNKINIHQFDLYGKYISTYNSKEEICKEYNMMAESLDNNLNKRTYSAFGYIWRKDDDINIVDGHIFLKDKFTYKENKIYERLRHRYTKVYQFSLNEEYINVFENVRDASEKTAISKHLISDAARHMAKTAKGFLWRYEYDVTINDNGIFIAV